eukprot:COSAG01_NODE_40_length_32708_cov_25.641234_29_plen_110_part_00
MAADMLLKLSIVTSPARGGGCGCMDHDGQKKLDGVHRGELGLAVLQGRACCWSDLVRSRLIAKHYRCVGAMKSTERQQHKKMMTPCWAAGMQQLHPRHAQREWTCVAGV